MADFEVQTAVSERADGDFALGLATDVRAARRRALLARAGGRDAAELPVVWLDQVHGAGVVTVGDDAQAPCGAEGDAVVTDRCGVVLEVRTADCAPVLLRSADGVIGAAHAGWRGVEAGVVQATARAMRDLGAGEIHAVVGPHLGAMCNEFGAADLARLVERFGPQAQACTSWGTPALDLGAALGVALREAGVELDRWEPSCTGCDPDRWYSHRMRGETGRMASFIWQRRLR